MIELGAYHYHYQYHQYKFLQFSVLTRIQRVTLTDLVTCRNESADCVLEPALKLVPGITPFTFYDLIN